MYTDEDLEWAYEFNSIIDQGRRAVQVTKTEADWDYKGDWHDCVLALVRLIQTRLYRLDETAFDQYMDCGDYALRAEQPKGEPWA